jgi:hypothetical protein
LARQLALLSCNVVKKSTSADFRSTIRPGTRGDAMIGTRGDVDRAMGLLFGEERPEEVGGPGWRDELREAFRRRALETHPDRAAALGRTAASLAEDFQELLEAFQLLSTLPVPRPRPAAVPHRAAERTARAPQDHVIHGSLPRRPLMFAEYLYYSGRVSWRNMVEAVAWQRRQRPAIGRIAVEWGHLSDEEVREILESRRREGTAHEPFGEYARRKGYLSASQLLALLGRQRRMQRRIGQYFVEAGLLAERDVRTVDDDLVRHNSRWRRAS